MFFPAPCQSHDWVGSIGLVCFRPYLCRFTFPIWPARARLHRPTGGRNVPWRPGIPLEQTGQCERGVVQQRKGSCDFGDDFYLWLSVQQPPVVPVLLRPDWLPRLCHIPDYNWTSLLIRWHSSFRAFDGPLCQCQPLGDFDPALHCGCRPSCNDPNGKCPQIDLNHLAAVHFSIRDQLLFVRHCCKSVHIRVPVTIKGEQDCFHVHIHRLLPDQMRLQHGIASDDWKLAGVK